jgi:hypothetical protein
MTFFVILNKKSHVASKNHIVLISLSTGGGEARRACHSITVPQHADALMTITQQLVQKGIEKGISARRSHVTERSERTGEEAKRNRSGR